MESHTKRWEKAFHNCPGAWYGNAPDGICAGNIAVDAKRVTPAVMYLRRRFKIMASEVSRDPNPGILFNVEWK